MGKDKFKNKKIEYSFDLDRVRKALGLPPDYGCTPPEFIPFSPDDTTAGTENELQTAIIGSPEDVDLPISIKNSQFYANLLRRVKSGDMPAKVLNLMEGYLKQGENTPWEHSWGRFPENTLSEKTRKLFRHDLKADKSDPDSQLRSDTGRFFFKKDSQLFLRLPVSYILKLALAEATVDINSPKAVQDAGSKYMNHYLNDNTSPEIFSFHPVSLSISDSKGSNIASETSVRFAYTQMLTQYANRHFRLNENGQKITVYFASHPPIRQKELNDIVPDNFYRELFMSPCLSGWDKGEEKYEYMQLCHQVLSRSQMNAVKKLKDAGIIISNLVVLPNISNISLANNGTHLSIGSRKLGELLSDPESGFTKYDEKYIGDLVIKITEHFLPLFVGSYSGAPYRLDFQDFHPEKALGFLSHELDFTHLRMIWRRWKKKAKIQTFGHSLTPFGPVWLDKLISRVFRLKGDYLPDFRLIDYLIALMSTDNSPALNGKLKNDKKLRKDLTEMGVFDSSMSLYLAYKLREHGKMGFSGFEGRYYSVFSSILNDLEHAANLQMLVTSLAYKYILSGAISHSDIPDTPSTESERRQIFFARSIGLPTFYVHKNTGNRFLHKILSNVHKTRKSRRYSGYVRVYNTEYCKALLQTIKEDAADIIDQYGYMDTIADLEKRVYSPEDYSSASILKKGILKKAGFKKPLKAESRKFNSAAEDYYRNELRLQHYRESLDSFESGFRKLDSEATDNFEIRTALMQLLPKGFSAESFLRLKKDSLLNDTAEENDLRIMIGLTTLMIKIDCGSWAKTADMEKAI